MTITNIEVDWEVARVRGITCSGHRRAMIASLRTSAAVVKKDRPTGPLWRSPLAALKLPRLQRNLSRPAFPCVTRPLLCKGKIVEAVGIESTSASPAP